MSQTQLCVEMAEALTIEGGRGQGRKRATGEMEDKNMKVQSGQLRDSHIWTQSLHGDQDMGLWDFWSLRKALMCSRGKYLRESRDEKFKFKFSKCFPKGSVGLMFTYLEKQIVNFFERLEISQAGYLHKFQGHSLELLEIMLSISSHLLMQKGERFQVICVDCLVYIDQG